MRHAMESSSDNYQSLLKRQFQRIMGKPTWARVESNTSNLDDEDIDELTVRFFYPDSMNPIFLQNIHSKFCVVLEMWPRNTSEIWTGERYSEN